jgi:proteasome accessory factor A
MGTETEYAVSDVAAAHYDPVRLSFDVVQGASDDEHRHIRWDYRQEDPVNDARGTRLERAAARPEMLTDTPAWHITNVIAPNGGRIYVDHAHPEYSSPESTDPFAAVTYDLAGDALMSSAAERASQLTGKQIILHRNNVDGKGASWGSHESYRCLRSVPFSTLSKVVTAHFVTRQLFTGSGRVGLGERSEYAGYQLSQRADYLHTPIGLQTTFDRPIVNTRDESHDCDDYRRLHVIVGDANRMQLPELLKLGTTSMVLWLTEQGHDADTVVSNLLDTLEFADPVQALHQVSHDLSLRQTLLMRSGARYTALQIQRLLFDAVCDVARRVYGSDEAGEVLWPDCETSRIMDMWRRSLDDLLHIAACDDDQRLSLRDEASRCEWLLKWQLLEGLRRRYYPDTASADRASWRDPRLCALDLSWGSLQSGASLVDKVASRCARPITQAAIADACRQAPSDTRAWLRSRLLDLFAPDVVAMSWSCITVRDHERPDANGAGGLLSFDMSDPLRFGKQEVESLLLSARQASEALELCNVEHHTNAATLHHT